MTDTIRQQFRKRRAALGMPYSAVARRAGVSLSTVKRVFAGKGTSLDTLIAIAGALGFSGLRLRIGSEAALI